MQEEVVVALMEEAGAGVKVVVEEKARAAERWHNGRLQNR